MATEAKDNTPTTNGEQEPASLMGIPPELRLDILERVVSLDTSRILGTSESGEEIYDLWSRLMISGSQSASPEESFPRQWDQILSWMNDKAERYTYQPRIAGILHTNRTLRKEGHDVYQRFAQLQIAAYEAEQEDFAAKLSRILERYRELESRMVSWSEIDRELQELKEELTRHLVEMAERGFRWHALKKISQALEQSF